MAKKKVVILGSNGMLGWDVARLLKSNGEKPICLDLPDFDITNSEQLRNAVSGADIIINCAAFTNVDLAEAESQAAFAVNADAVGELGKIAAENESYIIHISTDFVFDGQKAESYIETDVPNPINIYGKSKLQGEKLLAESQCRHCVVRVQWSYGVNGNNFIKKLISLSQQRESLKVVFDQIGSPTATAEMAGIVIALADKQACGLYHYAATDYVSRFDVAKFVFDRLSIKTELAACSSNEFVMPAKRPLNSRFCCDKIERLLDCEIENWKKPLVRFLDKL